MKFFQLSFLIICLVSLVVGCSFKDITGEANQGDKQLTILFPAGFETSALGSEITRVLKDASALLEKNHPGVTVTIDSKTAGNEYAEKLLKMEANEKIPEIVVVEPSLMGEFANHNILADLSNYANDDNITTDDFYGKLIEGANRNGVWLTIPMVPDPQVIFYNKDWFDQANLAYPSADWTWEQFSDTAKLLKSSRPMSAINQYGGVLPLEIFIMESLILSNGGSILSPDGKQASGYLNSDASALAVEYIVDSYRSEKLNEHSFDPSDVRSKYLLFSGNNAGMLLASSLNLYYFLPDLGEKLGVAPLPSFQNGLRINPTTSLGLSIMEQSDDKELAWELLKMISLEQNEISQRYAQFFLVNNPALANSTGQVKDPSKKVMLNELNYSNPTVFDRNQYFGRVYEGNSFREMLNLLVDKNGFVEIQEHLTLMAEYIDTALANGEAEAAAANSDTRVSQ